MKRALACISFALFAALGQAYASFAQGLFQFAGIKAVELLLAYEYQGNAPSAVTLKFSEGPAAVFYILLAEHYSMLP